MEILLPILLDYWESSNYQPGRWKQVFVGKLQLWERQQEFLQFPVIQAFNTLSLWELTFNTLGISFQMCLTPHKGNLDFQGCREVFTKEFFLQIKKTRILPNHPSLLHLLGSISLRSLYQSYNTLPSDLALLQRSFNSHNLI